MEILKVKYGSLSNFNKITKNNDTLYFITDTKQIYKGGEDYTGLISNVKIEDVKNEDGSTNQDKKLLKIYYKNGDNESNLILSDSTLNNIIDVLNGQGNDTTKGLVKLYDKRSKDLDVNKGTAATPKAIQDAYDDLVNYINNQISAGFAANDAMVFKGTIGADGTITSQDTTINGKKISAITNYSVGWTFRATAASTAALWSGANTTKVEAGDMIVAVKDYGTSNVATDWSIVQSNLIGAVTAENQTLTSDQLVVGNGTQKVKILAAGSAGQVLTIVNEKPAWANLPTEKDTTYTFNNGTDGSFTVTPSSGTAQKVSIGKPATATHADTAGNATTADTANKVKNIIKLKIGTNKDSGDANPYNLIDTSPTSFDGSSQINLGFGQAAAKDVSSNVENSQNVITAAAVYNALLWGTFNQ